MLEEWNVEVHQQSEWTIQRFQVREGLRDMYFREALNGFQLNDESATNEEIDSAFSNTLLLVQNRNRGLPRKGDSSRVELDAQGPS